MLSHQCIISRVGNIIYNKETFNLKNKNFENFKNIIIKIISFHIHTHTHMQ